MSMRTMINPVMRTIKAASRWRLVWMSVLASEILAAIIVCLMDLLLYGRIVGDDLFISGIAALLVSFIIAYLLIRFIEVLREADFRNADLLSNSAVATFVLDAKHRVVLWNKACEELTGVSAPAMLGTGDHWKPFYRSERQTLSDVIIAGNREDLSSLYAKHARSTLSPEGLQAEGWYENLNGKDRYIIFDAAPVYNGRGKLTAVVETLQDITSQKQAEEELARSESLLRTIIDTEPECVKIVSRDGTILEMNPAGLAIVEADSTAQVVGRPMIPFLASEHLGAMEDFCRKVFDGGSGSLEFEIIGIKGTRKWLETRAVPLRDERGVITALLGVTRDITERKQWEKTLNEQLRFLQQLIDSIPIPVFYKDTSGVYQGYNSAFEEFFGMPKEKLIGKTVYDIAPKELADKYYLMDKELFDRPGIQVYEYPVKHADGTVRDILFNKATYTDARGEVAGLLGVMQDMTGRKRMENALRQTNETLHAVIQASPLAVASFDADGNVGMWNPAAERIFGWREDEVLGRYNPLVTEHNRHEFMDLLQRVLEGESLMGVELRRRRKDDTPIDVSVSSAPLRNAHDIVGILSVISDITERKRAEEKIFASERKYRELFESATDAIFVHDRDGNFIDVNEAAYSRLGYTKEEMLALHLSRLVSPEFAAGIPERLTQMRERGAVVFESAHLKKNGTVMVVEVNARITEYEGKVAYLSIVRDITERKKAEEQLKLLKQSVDISIDAAFWFDAEGRFTYVNDAACASVGYSRDELLQMRLSDVNPQASREKWEKIWRQLCQLKTIHAEAVHRRKDGSLFPVEISSSYVKFGEREYVCGFARDITERKRAEQVIQRNYDAQTAINWILNISLKDISLDSIMKQALDLLLSITWLSFDARGSIFLVEGDPGRLVMKAQRGLSGSHRELCSSVSFGACLCGMAAARGEVVYAGSVDDRHETLYEGMLPHGHYCVPIMRAKTVLGVVNLYLTEGHNRDDREIEFLNAIATALAGIIERKRVEEEREKLIEDLRKVLETLSRSHREWQDTFDSITDMIALMDTNFTVLKANRAFSEYYGIEPAAAVNKKCYELIHDYNSPIPSCPHRITLAENKSSGAAYVDKRTGRTLSIFTFPYKSPAGDVIGSIHVMRDITEEREKEMRLITSERLASLGQMAAGIAHEINNPLASIAGCSEGLLSRVRKGQYETELFESYLNIIQEEVFRCKSITTGMLSFVRKTTYEEKDVNIAEVIEKTVEIIRVQGRLNNIEVVRTFHEPAPYIRGNEGELRQVLLALIINALDAMSDKGTLTLETEARGESVIVRITDTGEGIAPEIMSRIFDPFFTTKSEKGGTGLGLSIARKIVANHKGQIDVSSPNGKGTAVAITLPQ